MAPSNHSMSPTDFNWCGNKERVISGGWSGMAPSNHISSSEFSANGVAGGPEHL
jgi:hypothetical protein